MPYDINTNRLFIHIPKTGGSSINSVMGIKKGYDYLFSEDSRALQHLVPSRVKCILGDKFNDAFKFTVIRNPLDRAVSDYLWIKERLIVNSFDSYLDLATSVINSGGYYDKKYYDHFRPQVDYFEGIDYDLVIDFKKFREGVKRLFGKYPPKLNKKREDYLPTDKQVKRCLGLYDDDYKLYCGMFEKK